MHNSEWRHFGSQRVQAEILAQNLDRRLHCLGRIGPGIGHQSPMSLPVISGSIVYSF